MISTISDSSSTIELVSSTFIRRRKNGKSSHFTITLISTEILISLNNIIKLRIPIDSQLNYSIISDQFKIIGLYLIGKNKIIDL